MQTTSSQLASRLGCVATLKSAFKLQPRLGVEWLFHFPFPPSILRKGSGGGPLQKMGCCTGAQSNPPNSEVL